MTVAFRASEQHHRHSGMRVFRLPPPRHLPPRVPIKPCLNSKWRARTPAASVIALGHPPPKALRGCAPARMTAQTATERPRSPPPSTVPSAMASQTWGRRRGRGYALARPVEGRGRSGASPRPERRGRGCARRRTPLAATVSGRPDGEGSGRRLRGPPR